MGWNLTCSCSCWIILHLIVAVVQAKLLKIFQYAGLLLNNLSVYDGCKIYFASQIVPSTGSKGASEQDDVQASLNSAVICLLLLIDHFTYILAVLNCTDTVDGGWHCTMRYSRLNDRILVSCGSISSRLSQDLLPKATRLAGTAFEMLRYCRLTSHPSRIMLTERCKP